MQHLFQKGMPRPAGAGRRKGTPNKSTVQISQFCKSLVENPQFQNKWRRYFVETPMHRIDVKLIALVFAYAYGKPRERVELAGGLEQPQTNVLFYIPHNNREDLPAQVQT